MNRDTSNFVVHVLAWITAVIALLPISVGAMVTTVDAGMAFADWPTSHGQGMLAFPWWQSQGDEFLEHGHRLAGMLTGFATLILTAAACLLPCRPGVRPVVLAVLVGVIFQGLLGGWRVLADERVIAMLHAIFAAIVFSLMAVLIVMTGRNWACKLPLEANLVARRALFSGVALVAVVSIQYLLGSLLRHLGLAEAWLIHPWFALAVVAAALLFRLQLQKLDSRLLRRGGTLVLALIAAQALLGLVTWGVRYGFPAWNIMAVQQSTVQVAVRSLHKVLGLLTYMSSVVVVVRLWHSLPLSASSEYVSSSRHSVEMRMPSAGGAM